VKQIGPASFYDCRSLLTFCVPARLEVLEWGPFRCCTLLTELLFEIPFRLNRLQLPPTEFRSLCGPDTIEVLLCSLRRRGARSCALQFGAKSQLREIELERKPRQYGPGNDREQGICIFLHFLERHFRNCRSKCEFS
jgi:hypothetical protein